MTRRPLAPDLWEQALINGRRIHPADDAVALEWSERWYEVRGGAFENSEPRPLAEVVGFTSLNPERPETTRSPLPPQLNKPVRRASGRASGVNREESGGTTA